DDEWDRVLTAISVRLGHAAALLDGELPAEIASDAAAAGLDLLPGGGEIGPRCSCPDDADPCKHSAAACYLIADALDADPFAVFLLRGRSKEQVLAGVRARRRGSEHVTVTASSVSSAPSARSVDEGVDARSAFSAPVLAGPGPAAMACRTARGSRRARRRRGAPGVGAGRGPVPGHRAEPPAGR